MRNVRVFSRLVPVVAAIGLAGAGCGDPPSAAPDVQVGSLRVVAHDTLAIDSIRIDLDDVRIGQFHNPHLLHGIVAGVHKVLVASLQGATAARTVTIVRDRQAELVLQLLATGPYVGSAAPLFTARTTTGDTVSLERFKGKVVFLAFFEHT